MTQSDRKKYFIKFIMFSLIGIFMFFVPIDIGGKSTIPLDHLVTYITSIPYFYQVYGFILISIGVIRPFVKGTWKSTKVKTVFSLIDILAIPFFIMVVFNIGPAGLLADNMLPFIFNKVVIPVTTIVPVGAVFLAFMVSYGLMEFIGVFMRPIMVPIWKTPGKSAVDAVASFVGSYSLALLITNRVYKEGMYTGKEAAIIATGFSTVSAAFMIIVAKTLGLMDYWTFYFWTTVVITFIVTAITARIYPLRTKPDEYYQGVQGDVEVDVEGSKVKYATNEAITVCSKAPSILENTKSNLIDGLGLAVNMAPSLMAVGSLGLIVAHYTPLFDLVGYIFLPFTWLIRLPEPLLAAKAVSTTIAEMFLAAPIVADAALITKYVIGVVSISEILFFSASIPAMMATEIPLKMSDYFIIWIERVILSILVAAPFAYLFVNFIA